MRVLCLPIYQKLGGSYTQIVYKKEKQLKCPLVQQHSYQLLQIMASTVDSRFLKFQYLYKFSQQFQTELGLYLTLYLFQVKF